MKQTKKTYIDTFKTYFQITNGIKNRISFSTKNVRTTKIGSYGYVDFLVTNESAKKILEILKEDQSKLPVQIWMGALCVSSSHSEDLDIISNILEEN